MANGLVQQNTGPAWAQDHIHNPGRGIYGAKIDQRDAQRLLGLGLPGIGGHQPVQPIAPAAAAAALFAAAIFLDDHADIHPAHGAHIAHACAIGAQNFDFLQRRCDRGANLHNPWVKRAGIGIDFAQRVQLAGKADAGDRVFVGVKAPVGWGGPNGQAAPAIAHGQLRGGHSAAQGGLGYFAGMGIARYRAADRAQAKALACVIAGGADAAIIKHQRLGAAAFQE